MSNPHPIRPEGTALADAVAALRDATQRLQLEDISDGALDEAVAEINRLSQEIAERLPRALREVES